VEAELYAYNMEGVRKEQVCEVRSSYGKSSPVISMEFTTRNSNETKKIYI